MSTVKFDDVEIVADAYSPKSVKHESAPKRDLTLLDLARAGGSVFITEKYGIKTIVITGSLKAATSSALETAIDNFKELFSRVQKNLDIGFAGGTRRYVATCVFHNFNREHFNIDFIPWTATFIVASGIGENISETTLVSAQQFTAADYSSAMTFLGSADPKPRIRIKCTASTTDPKGISIENDDTGEKIVITNPFAFTAGDYYEVDCRLKTTTEDGDALPFYGVFPTWIVGANNYTITIGEILNQNFEDISVGTGTLYYTNIYRAMSFSVPYTDTTFQTLALSVWEKGTAPANLVIVIVEDLNGEPDQTSPVTNASFTITPADVDGTQIWVKKNSTNSFTLEANKRYWIVPIHAGGDVNNCYIIGTRTGTLATYKRGNTSFTSNDGGSWSDEPTTDMAFRLYYGGKADAAKTYEFDVYYYKRYL